MDNIILLIIPILVIIILFTLIGKFISIYSLCSILFLFVFYTNILITIFFTFGAYTEKKLIKDQLDFLLRKIPKGELQPLQITDNIKKEDNELIEKNKHLKKKVKYYSLGISIALLLLSMFLWYYKNRTDKSYTIHKYIHFIVYKNLIILLCVIFIQLLFYNFIVGVYRPVDYNTIGHNLIEYIKDKKIV